MKFTQGSGGKFQGTTLGQAFGRVSQNLPCAKPKGLASETWLCAMSGLPVIPAQPALWPVTIAGGSAYTLKAPGLDSLALLPALRTYMSRNRSMSIAVRLAPTLQLPSGRPPIRSSA